MPENQDSMYSHTITASRDRIKIDMAPVKLRIESDPYVVFIGKTFVPVIDVYNIKTKREHFLIISPVSISGEIQAWMMANDGSIVNLEFWINKVSDEKFSKYEISIA